MCELLYCSRGDTVCARVTTEAYGIPKPLTGTVHVERGEDVASQRGGEARDAASSGVGRIRNGHAHGLNDPRARLHGDEGLMLVVEALACQRLFIIVFRLPANETEAP